jgi:hypothetical protein
MFEDFKISDIIVITVSLLTALLTYIKQITTTELRHLTGEIRELTEVLSVSVLTVAQHTTDIKLHEWRCSALEERLGVLEETVRRLGL